MDTFVAPLLFHNQDNKSLLLSQQLFALVGQAAHCLKSVEWLELETDFCLGGGPKSFEVFDWVAHLIGY